MSGIELKLREYCDYCPDFEPVVSKYDLTSFEDKSRKVQSAVKCEYADRCEQMYERIRHGVDN